MHRKNVRSTLLVFSTIGNSHAYIHEEAIVVANSHLLSYHCLIITVIPSSLSSSSAVAIVSKYSAEMVEVLLLFFFFLKRMQSKTMALAFLIFYIQILYVSLVL